jgi:hypothetical protein
MTLQHALSMFTLRTASRPRMGELMRYVIIDPEGSSRAVLGSLREVYEWANAVKGDDPDLFDELQLVTYDAAGTTVANQWLSDYFPPVPSVTANLYAVSAASVSPMRVHLAALSAGWFGTAASTTPVSLRPQRLASETRSLEPAEMTEFGMQPVP